jgi:hypothetical protein
MPTAASTCGVGGRGGDRHRHRIEPKDRVLCHRALAVRIPQAKAFEQNRLTVLLDQQHRPRNPSCRNFVVQVVADMPQTISRNMGRDGSRTFGAARLHVDGKRQQQHGWGFGLDPLILRGPIITFTDDWGLKSEHSGAECSRGLSRHKVRRTSTTHVRAGVRSQGRSSRRSHGERMARSLTHRPWSKSRSAPRARPENDKCPWRSPEKRSKSGCSRGKAEWRGNNRRRAVRPPRARPHSRPGQPHGSHAWPAADNLW